MDRSGELSTITRTMLAKGWFYSTGVHAVVDGQFGSTGKGVAASLLGHVASKSYFNRNVMGITNAGPNSGHTAVYSGHTMMTQQLPISSVQSNFCGYQSIAYLNGGSIISLEKLMEEINKFNMKGKVIVHPNAAIIEDIDVKNDNDPNSGAAKIAGTGKGVGSALARKISREGNVASAYVSTLKNNGIAVLDSHLGGSFYRNCSIMEVAQGFSLGVNQAFYPHCTSRECTVIQALSDADIHPAHLRKTLMTVRTYPIRVGNTSVGNSGGHYPDQVEIPWSEIGVTPELTTVTKRERRLFTWSRVQFRSAVRSNRPDAIFLNFCNYMTPQQLGSLIDTMESDYEEIMGHAIPLLLTGWSAETEDVKIWR